MTIDNRSSNQNYKLPNPQNLLADDAGRLIDAINAIDADVDNRYTKAEVDQAIADLIDGSPDTLNTLNEIAAAIADDSDYFTTINTAIATKSNLAGGNTFTGNQIFEDDVRIQSATPRLLIQDTTSGQFSQGDGFGQILFKTSDPDAGGVGTTHAYIKAEHSRNGSGHNNPDAGLVFGTSQGTNPTAAARMYLTNDGQLGVGTRPSSKFHVAGSVRTEGDVIPDTDNTGNVGTSASTFADGHFTDFQVDSTLTVRGAIDLADNDVLRLGSGDDAQIVHNGSNLYIKMLADDDVIITDNNSSDAERFRFDVNEGRFFVDDNIYAGRAISSYPKSGVHSITAYGRNSSSHADTTTWSAYTQINGDYRGEGNEATTEDTAMLYAVQQIASGADTYLHNLDVRGRAWHWSSVYAGRGRNSTTGTATSPYRTGEHSFNAYAGSGNITYIAGRSVADNDFVFHADVVSPKIEFRANGNGYFDGGADVGSADYAEMFEWLDGNPDDEDRRGYAVCLDGEFIRFATANDAPEELLGIVSAEPGVLGDSASLNWSGQFLRDEFGRKLTTPVEYLVWNAKGLDAPDPENEHGSQDERLPVSELGTGSELDLRVPDYAREADIRKTFYQLVENPDYDPEQTYVNRRARKEWDAIGMLGKLALRKDQPVGDRWRKLKPINDKLDLWLVR
jgi:hypothetical protein